MQQQQEIEVVDESDLQVLVEHHDISKRRAEVILSKLRNDSELDSLLLECCRQNIQVELVHEIIKSRRVAKQTELYNNNKSRENE